MSLFKEQRLIHVTLDRLGANEGPIGYEKNSERDARNVAENIGYYNQQQQEAITPSYRAVDKDIRCIFKRGQEHEQATEKFIVTGKSKETGAELGKDGRLGLCAMKRRLDALHERKKRGCKVDNYELRNLQVLIQEASRDQLNNQRQQRKTGMDYFEYADRTDRGLPQPTSVFKGIQAEVQRRRELPSVFEGIAEVVKSFIEALKNLNKEYDAKVDQKKETLITEDKEAEFFEEPQNKQAIETMAETMNMPYEELLEDMKAREWSEAKFGRVTKQVATIKVEFDALKKQFELRDEDAGGYKLGISGIELIQPYGMLHELCGVSLENVPKQINYPAFLAVMRMRKEGFIPGVDLVTAGTTQQTPAVAEATEGQPTLTEADRAELINDVKEMDQAEFSGFITQLNTTYAQIPANKRAVIDSLKTDLARHAEKIGGKLVVNLQSIENRFVFYYLLNPL